MQESQSRYLILEMLAWISRLLLMIDICFPGEVRECILVVYYRLIVHLLLPYDLFLAPKGSAWASQSHASHHGIKRRSSLRSLPSFLPVCLLRALPLSRSTQHPLLSIKEQNQAANQHVLVAKQRSTHQPRRNHQFVFLYLSSLTSRILVSFFASGLKDPANTADFAALSDFLSAQVSWDEDIYFGPLLSIAFPVLVSNAKALQYKRELNRNSQKQRSERRNSLRKSSNFMIELPALFLSNEKSPNWPVRWAKREWILAWHCFRAGKLRESVENDRRELEDEHCDASGDCDWLVWGIGQSLRAWDSVSENERVSEERFFVYCAKSEIRIGGSIASGFLVSLFLDA